MDKNEEEILLTLAGRQHIEQELERLVTVDRHEVADRIRDAKDYGDLNENPEYEAAKNAQAFVEARIFDLKRILSSARVMGDDEVRTDTAGMGAMVTVRDVDFGDEWTMTLVSPVEADPDKDRISVKSPIGQALVGKRVGDTVQVKTPAGKTCYEIIQIGK